MRAIEQHYHVVLLILYKLVPTLPLYSSQMVYFVILYKVATV